MSSSPFCRLDAEYDDDMTPTVTLADVCKKSSKKTKKSQKVNNTSTRVQQQPQTPTPATQQQQQQQVHTDNAAHEDIVYPTAWNVKPQNINVTTTQTHPASMSVPTSQSQARTPLTLPHWSQVVPVAVQVSAAREVISRMGGDVNVSVAQFSESKQRKFHRKFNLIMIEQTRLIVTSQAQSAQSFSDVASTSSMPPSYTIVVDDSNAPPAYTEYDDNDNTTSPAIIDDTDKTTATNNVIPVSTVPMTAQTTSPMSVSMPMPEKKKSCWKKISSGCGKAAKLYAQWWCLSWSLQYGYGYGYYGYGYAPSIAALMYMQSTRRNCAW